jgi:hypothetical protein
MKKLRVGMTFSSRWPDLLKLFRTAEAWFFFNESRPTPERGLPRSFFKFLVHWIENACNFYFFSLYFRRVAGPVAMPAESMGQT